MFTIQNTHPDFYWLPNFTGKCDVSRNPETITTATTFWQYRKLSEKWAAETCDNNLHVPFQNHCFAYRGEGGTHDAAQSEFGQLISSMGTDTIPAIVYANRYYNMKGKFVSGSILHLNTVLQQPISVSSLMRLKKNSKSRIPEP